MLGLLFPEPTNEVSLAATLLSRSIIHAERDSLMKTAAENRGRKKSLLSDAALLDLVQRQTFLFFGTGRIKRAGLRATALALSPSPRTISLRSAVRVSASWP